MITNIEQLLIEKIKSWTQESANQFHNNYNRRHKHDGQYLWEQVSDGMIIWRDIGAHYISNRGEVLKISLWYSNIDWDMHLQMHHYSLQTNKFRVEIPLESKIIIINNQEFLLTRVQRPNYELGHDFQLDLFNDKVNLDYFIQFINDSVHPISYMKTLNQLPEVRFPVSRRIFDSKGHFWADLKQWRIPYDQFIKMQLVDLEFVLGMLEKNFKFNKNDSIIIKDYAETIWKSI